MEKRLHRGDRRTEALSGFEIGIMERNPAEKQDCKNCVSGNQRKQRFPVPFRAQKFRGKMYQGDREEPENGGGKTEFRKHAGHRNQNRSRTPFAPVCKNGQHGIQKNQRSLHRIAARGNGIKNQRGIHRSQHHSGECGQTRAEEQESKPAAQCDRCKSCNERREADRPRRSREKEHPLHKQRVQRMVVRRGEIVENRPDVAHGIVARRPDFIVFETGRKGEDAQNGGGDEHRRACSRKPADVPPFRPHRHAMRESASSTRASFSLRSAR